MKSITEISFYKELTQFQSVWTFSSDDGIPSITNDEGQHAMPLWSSRDRANNVLKKEENFAGFNLLEIPWDLFRNKWIPDLKNKKFNVTLNWLGGDQPALEESPEELENNAKQKEK
jgi:hypothetical protein